jgi:glycosyltransferase involved in cell wall biosynthesis
MLVSAIMPTRGRSSFVARALACFDSQTWPDKELVIADDADHPSFPDGLRARQEIQYDCLPRRLSIGAKRNVCCSRATGEIIWHLDDDDWSAPERMADQVNRLLETGKPVTGYSALEFRDDTRRWLYASRAPDYAPGSTLCYTRAWWISHPFVDRDVREDGQFTDEAKGNISVVDAGGLMWASIHPGNTSPRDLRTKEWSQL